MTNRGVTKKEILRIFATFPKGKALPVETLLDRIQMQATLTDYDMAVHTTSRPTSYPRWKDRTQAVLHQLKMNGKAVHDPKRHTYMFV